MAGKRQHILPRFLLRGFASRVDGEKIFTWVYRKSGQNFETTVENVGLEKHFYGRDGEISADEIITDVEGDYAKLVKRLREQTDGTEVHDERVSELVTHLSIRTKQLRESFRTSTEYLLDEITAYLADASNLETLVLSKPQLIQEELEKQLQGFQVPHAQKTFLIELVKAYAPALVDEHMTDVQNTLRELVGEIRTVLPRAIREGHIKALAKDPAPASRSQTYQGLRWFVRESSTPVILGDIACLFEINANRRFKPFNDKGDPITNIFLPLSANKLLLGTAFSSAYHVDFGIINEAIAKCSYEYFVCSESSTENARLASMIGAWAGILTQEEIDGILSDIMTDLERDAFGR
jgi:hypothetical protein